MEYFKVRLKKLSEIDKEIKEQGEIIKFAVGEINRLKRLKGKISHCDRKTAEKILEEL